MQRNIQMFAESLSLHPAAMLTNHQSNERKFSWRWNIVGKLFQGMENNLWKNESKIIFRCLVRVLWKCTESSIEIMQIRYILADFELSYLKNYLAPKLCCFNHQCTKWNAWRGTQAYVHCIKKGKTVYLKREKIALYDFTLNDFTY